MIQIITEYIKMSTLAFFFYYTYDYCKLIG